MVMYMHACMNITYTYIICMVHACMYHTQTHMHAHTHARTRTHTSITYNVYNVNDFGKTHHSCTNINI